MRCRTMLIYWVCPVIQQVAHRPNSEIKSMQINQDNQMTKTNCIQTRSMLVKKALRKDDYLIVKDNSQRLSGWSAC